MARSWRRRIDLIWRGKILGFLCGAMVGLASVAYASEQVGIDLAGLLWKVFAGIVGIAGWLIKDMVGKITARVDRHDAELSRLAEVPDKLKQIDSDIKKLEENSIGQRQWEQFIQELRDLKGDMREFQMSSIKWRARVNQKLDIDEA